MPDFSKVCPRCGDSQVIVEKDRFCWCYACEHEWDLEKIDMVVEKGITVGELIQKLAEAPLDAEVWHWSNGCYQKIKKARMEGMVEKTTHWTSIALTQEEKAKGFQAFVMD